MQWMNATQDSQDTQDEPVKYWETVKEGARVVVLRLVPFIWLAGGIKRCGKF